MSQKQTIDFKAPLWMVAWLDTALEKEKEKYEKCPVVRDHVPGHEAAQGWGYVVAGYSLAEQSFKALLHVRGEENVPKKHSLSILFNLFGDDDKTILREYYTDYQATIGGSRGAFPFSSLDDFLVNLDGARRGDDHIGSFDWRYFLIEEKKSQNMPLVSVDYLHEIAFGSTRIIEHAITHRSTPSQYTRTYRMRRERTRKRDGWLTVRMNSDGWDELGDRLEILWGPDYLGRYDLCLFKGRQRTARFSEIPTDLALPVVDKRNEIENFDVEEGYRRIGVVRNSRPPTN